MDWIRYRDNRPGALEVLLKILCAVGKSCPWPNRMLRAVVRMETEIFCFFESRPSSRPSSGGSGYVFHRRLPWMTFLVMHRRRVPESALAWDSIFVTISKLG